MLNLIDKWEVQWETDHKWKVRWEPVDIELFTLWALENMQSGLNQLWPPSY